MPSTAPAVPTDPYRLPTLPYQRFEVELVARGAAQLPSYQGSLLRGAWGHALRALVCPFSPDDPCASCLLRRACAYPPLFEPVLEAPPPTFLTGLPEVPRPFVFEPTGESTSFRPGAALRFGLVLLGRAVALQGHALLAVARMAPAGLGAQRHPFELAAVRFRDADGLPVEAWDGQRQRLGIEAPALLPTSDAAPARVRLHFTTPTRILADGAFRQEIGLRELVFRLLRRVRDLAAIHTAEPVVDEPFQPLLEAADRVKITRSAVRWMDWQRYSNRQRTHIHLGGFVGSLELEGELGPLWPLLRLGEIVHVGKGATLGLGRLELEPLA